MNVRPLARALAGVVGLTAAGILGHFVPPFEGTIKKTYRDPIGIITACTGHTGPELRMGQTFTAAQCGEMLDADLSIAAQGVQACTDEPLSDNEIAAYTSFAFNAGVAAFCGSTLNRKLAAHDHAGACAELTRWTRANGRELPGLVRRRGAERSLCETP